MYTIGGHIITNFVAGPYRRTQLNPGATTSALLPACAVHTHLHRLGSAKRAGWTSRAALPLKLCLVSNPHRPRTTLAAVSTPDGTASIQFAPTMLRRRRPFAISKLELVILALFVWLISHQPAVLFSQNKQSASSTFLSEQISISHQPPAKRTSCLAWPGDTDLGVGERQWRRSPR
jgi:hypothetical protein